MKYALGFSLEGREIKTALVCKKGKKLLLEFVHSFPLEEQEPIDKLLAPIVKGKRVKMISGLAAADVILRDLQLPMVNPKKILAVLPFQAETLIPFPPEETALYTRISKINRKQSHISLAATKNEKVASHLACLQDHHLDPTQVSTSFHALARWASFQNKDTNPWTKVCYLGRSESFFLLMEKEKIVCAKLLSSSSLAELEKADEFLSSKFPETQTVPWLHSGDVSNAEHAAFAIAIGLAIEALSPDGVQWRQGNFSPEPLLKKQKKQYLTASAAFLFAALLAGPIGHAICSSYENNLLHRAHECLARIAPEKKVGPRDLESAARALSKKMIELKKEEKLGAFAPKVTELLAFLSACTPADGDQPSLTSLTYSLTPQGQIEVDLTLEANPLMADSFYKKLRKEPSLVDLKQGITWDKQAPLYSAHFYLK